MAETVTLPIEEALANFVEVPEIFAMLLDLYDGEADEVEISLVDNEVSIKPIFKDNPTVSSVHVPSTDWQKDEIPLVAKAINEEMRYTLSPWYVPDSVDAHGEWSDKASVQRAFWDYLAKNDREIRLQHNLDIVAGKWVEGLTWPHEVTVPVKHPEGDRELTFPAGTPYLGVIWEPWAWELIKKGELRGLSIGGRAKRAESEVEVEDGYNPTGTVDFQKMLRQESGGWTVYDEKGKRSFGTYDTKEEAQERLRQIEYFSKGDLETGDFVSWNSSGGTARGRIDRIVRDGKINVPNSSFTITGTEEEPAALISVWRKGKDGWEKTDTQVGHKLDSLRSIQSLEKSDDFEPLWQEFAKAETFEPPKGVAENAKRALQWIKDGHAGSGFTDVGRRRASQLANRQNVSLETIGRIKSYLSRHKSDARATGFEAGEDGFPSAGRVAWDAWGGDEALSWATRILDSVEKTLIEEVEKHLKGKHDQASHARGGYEGIAARRAEAMSKGDVKRQLPRDAQGRVVCPEATGGYKAGIPEEIDFGGEKLTPEHSLWHHMESDGKGGYQVTAERDKLHKQIVKDAVDGVPVSDDPTFYMLGGGPAAGKTTAVKSGLAEVPNKSKAVQVNADDVKDQLPEYKRLKNSPNDDEFFNAASFGHEESSMVAKQIQKTAFANKQDVVLDGTGDNSIDNLEGKVRSARGNGYKVNGIYTTVPTEMAIERSNIRSLKESERRFVPTAVVAGTHASVSRVFPQAIDRGLFNSVSLIDTSVQGAAKLIGRGAGKSFDVLEEDLFFAFLQKGGALG